VSSISTKSKRAILNSKIASRRSTDQTTRRTLVLACITAGLANTKWQRAEPEKIYENKNDNVALLYCDSGWWVNAGRTPGYCAMTRRLVIGEIVAVIRKQVFSLYLQSEHGSPDSK
jgi:hypothetical protein